jgi:hypothetical protein
MFVRFFDPLTFGRSFVEKREEASSLRPMAIISYAEKASAVRTRNATHFPLIS